jgi:hypothetical protein
VAVPEERHALAKRGRRVEHVVDPPLLELADVEPLLLRGIVATGEGERLGDRGLEHPVERLRVAVGLRLRELGVGGAEGGAPQQMRDARGLGAEWREPVEAHLVPERPGDRDRGEGRLGAEGDEPGGGDADPRGARRGEDRPPVEGRVRVGGPPVGHLASQSTQPARRCGDDRAPDGPSLPIS